MPDLVIQITKRAGGSTVLWCARADHSFTWQCHSSRSASFFPLHDLTHFAVETELRFRHGFYGLIADGWEIDQTTGKSARGPLPSEAIFVEFLVGQLDLERASGSEWSAHEVNRHAVQYFANKGGTISPRSLTDDDLARVRARLRELFDRWGALPSGQTLELLFDR